MRPLLVCAFLGLLLAGTTVLLGNRAPSGDPVAALHAPRDTFDVSLTDHPERGEFVIEIGPVDIPASGPEHQHHHGHYGVLPAPETVRFPKSVYLTGFSVEVVDGEGRALPTHVLHHMNVIHPERRELFLPISQRLVAAGKETGTQVLPEWLMGSPVAAGTDAVVTVMLHNPTETTLTGVRVLLRLPYRTAGGIFPLFEVYPFQVDVQFPAGEKAFDLPPGRSSFAWEGSPSLEGRVMAIGSHLHEYAQSIRLDDVTTGQRVWEGYPIEDEEGALAGVTVGRLYRTLGKKLYPDHRYRVTVTYHNPTKDTLHAGGMGVVAGVFMPSEATSWPQADTTDPLYVLDRKHYLRQVAGPYEKIAAQLGLEEHDSENGAPVRGDHQH